MPVDDEVVIGGVLVLADARFDQRRIFRAGEAIGEIAARVGEAVVADDALSRGRIKRRSARVDGEFEAAALIPRNAIPEMIALVGPDLETTFVEARVARGCAEDKDVLLRNCKVRAYRSREKLGQPW